MSLGPSARRAPEFDAQARAQLVEKEVETAKGTAYWLTSLAGRRKQVRELRQRLAAETARLAREAELEGERLRDVVARADLGEGDALVALLQHWMSLRPEALAPLHLEIRQLFGAQGEGEWLLEGHAIGRADIERSMAMGEQNQPRARQRPAQGASVQERLDSGVDDYLSEVNAAAVLSALVALFSGPVLRRVQVRLKLTPPGSRDPIEWVWMLASVNNARLRAAIDDQSRAVDSVRVLGGDVGRCQSLRYTPARTTVNSWGLTAASVSPVREQTPATPRPTPVETPTAPRALRPPQSPRGAQAPPIPTPESVRNESFAAVARRYTGYSGDPSAPFVAFHPYSAAYAHMDAAQLAYYFRWRDAIRQGAAIRTDVGYILVHAYELLHLVGTPSPSGAARQLERLWGFYRRPFPELDDNLVSWMADLLATEVSREAAVALFERALLAGARLREDEAMLVVDRYWERGDYQGMPNAGIALLARDPHLWDGKFYLQYNAGAAGTGRVDRAYREAFAITDRVVTATSGRSPRELAIARHGRTEVGRTAFVGAVYDFGRKSAVLGTITSLPHAAPVANTYRNALRYTEGALRGDGTEPDFPRGVYVRAELARALDERMAAFLEEEAKGVPPAVAPLALASPPSNVAADSDGFGTVELEVLRVVSREPLGVGRDEGRTALLRELAERHATTPLQLIQRVNEVARGTPFGNRVIEVAEDGPRIHERARMYVARVLGHGMVDGG